LVRRLTTSKCLNTESISKMISFDYPPMFLILLFMQCIWKSYQKTINESVMVGLVIDILRVQILNFL
jgi:hypothetical protein